MNAKNIAKLLAQQAESVVRYLLPNGKCIGNNWCVGSIRGKTGESLKISLCGDNIGVWKDFASSDKGGDLLNLWAEVKRISLPEAITQARQYLGCAEIDFHPRRKSNYAAPSIEGEWVKADSPVGKYLCGSRCLSTEILKRYQTREKGDEILFPFYENENLCLLKHLSIHRKNGKKDIRISPSGCKPILFGWQAIPENTTNLVITEGEIDAMSLNQYGYHALSVPFGGGSGNKQRWVEYEYEKLEQFEKIYLCFDKDEQGRAAVEELVIRLGAYRCYVVTLPYKDANECLMQNVSQQAIDVCFNNAKNFDPAELKSAAYYCDEVKNAFYSNDDNQTGLSLPWDKAYGKILLNNEELSLWTGINGHGKSQLLGQIALHAMLRDHRVCIASMELKPKRLLMRMTRQAAALDKPSPDYIDAIHAWYQDKLWIFELTGTAKAERLLEVFLYARKRYGITFFIIDSLMKCGIAEDDYTNQKKFVEALCDFKNQYGCQIHLVTHPRKGQDETKAPGKLDMKGTGALTDLADNCFSVWRNKSKEEKIQAYELRKQNIPEELLSQPDCLLTCDKQRNGEWEGKLGLYFDKKSFQYLDNSKQKSKRYVSYVAANTCLGEVSV